MDDDGAEAVVHRQAEGGESKGGSSAEGGESKRASSAEGGRGQAVAASTFEVCFKTMLGNTIRVPVHNDMTIDEVKQALERKSNGDPSCRADSVKLVYAG